MLNRKSRSVRSIVAAAGLVACALPAVFAHAQTTDTPTPPQTPKAPTSALAASIDRAAELLDSGKVVQAREMLIDLTSASNTAKLSDRERARAMALAQKAIRQVKQLSPSEVSLQTAEAALARGEFAMAVAQAQAVVNADEATNAQTKIANQIIADANARKATIAGEMDARIAAAAQAFDAGDVAGARTKLEQVVRSGVTLTDAQQSKVDAYQWRVLEAGNATVAAGMMQNAEPREVQPVDEAEEAAKKAAEEAQRQAEEAAKKAAEEAQPAANQPAAVPQPTTIDPVAQARRIEAQGLLAEADFAWGQNSLVDAKGKYARVLSQFGEFLTEEERTRVQGRISEADIRMGGAGSSDLLSQTISQNQVARQAAIAEFDNDLAQAQAALSRGDTTRARDLTAQAKVRISSARNVFSNDEIASYQSRADEMLSSIDAAEQTLRAEAIAKQTQENQDAARTAAQAQADDKNRRLNEAVDRVRALQTEMKYDEALQVVESQILFLDPTNPTGLLLRDVLRDATVFQRASSINRARIDSYVGQDLDNLEAAIAPRNLLDYPKDWPAISDRRGTPVAFSEAEENRRALALLQNKRIPVAFNDTPFENVVSFLQAVTQLNIDVDWASLENASVDRTAPVTLNLTNVTVETVLNRVMEKVSPDSATGAAWTISDGVLNIASKEQINRQKTLAIYDIRDLIIEVPNYDNAPEFDLQQALQSGQSGGGGGGQSPFQDADNEDPERRPLQERTDEIIQIITTNVDPDGWRDTAGGETGFIQQLGGLLIITNTPANHRAIHGLLSKLREYRALQINVETRFLLVSQDFFEQIGFDLDVYFNANGSVVQQARTTRPTTRASDFFNFQQSPGYQATFPQLGAAGAGTNRTPLGSPWSPVGVGQNSLGLSESLIGTDFAQDVFSTAPAMGIAGQFLDDIQVDFLIKATQADRRTVSLTAPRLTFTNGQISNIYVATQVSFVSDLEPVVSDSAVGFDPTTNSIPEGVILEVDGTVSADRRYVTMNVNTAVSRIESIQNLAVSALAGGQLVQSGATQSFIQLPQTTVTRVQTTVTVPDQGTILLGGQRLTTEQEVESGVPVLSKIPILNRLFSNRVETKEESTLLILLKPTILIQNELEERSFPGLDDSLRMPFGG
ncbi:MAG TPA: hypothetical protein VK157_00985 [Phycisphaerales bacterium]|nr:hypothetical protein [Phycisphaerales bacterium]